VTWAVVGVWSRIVHSPRPELPIPEVAAGPRRGLDVPMIPTQLEPFWPGRRGAQFDELCSPAA
jgi:hypothetical protein